ncbi:MAG: hypothetical protein VB858_00990, partial [Planctomycetaceae bacterium]
VVLVNGEPEPESYESLGEAIRSAPNGAVIELRMDGPLITPCLVIRQDRLTIRAAPGFRPEIMPDRDLSGDAQALLTTSGQLRLEGLALSVRRHRVSGLQDRDLHVVLCRDGGLQMLNCRLERSGTSSCLKLDGVTSSRVENCELLSGNGAGIEWKPTRDASLIVRNSLFIGEAGCAVPHPAENTGFPRLQVLQCVLATRYGLELILPAGTSRETDSGGPVGVVCRYSVFAVGNSVLRIGLPEKEQLSGRPKNFENMAARIRAAIVWRDDRTLFGDQSQMQFFSCSGRSRLSDFPDELRDWCRFWGMKSFHRPVQNRIQFRSGESQTKRPPYPLRLAREYAVDQPLPVNAGREKFGIDPLIVGPGAGYVQWISRLE